MSSDGIAPANPDDSWFRPITNKNHRKRNGQLHHTAIVLFLDPPQDISQSWSYELSGRLLSITSDITADVARRVKAQIAKRPDMAAHFGFHGLMHAKVSALGKVGNNRTAIYPDPNDDAAHANLVIYGLDEGRKRTFADALILLLSVCEPADLTAFEATRIRASSSETINQQSEIARGRLAIFWHKLLGALKGGCDVFRRVLQDKR